jgi:hypothetical protein
VSRGERGGSLTVVNLSFLDRGRYFFTLTRAEWTPFQTHCYSENPVTPEIEPGTSGLLFPNILKVFSFRTLFNIIRTSIAGQAKRFAFCYYMIN